MMWRMRRLQLMVIVVGALLLAGACSAPVDSGPKAIRAANIPEALRTETSSATCW